MNNTNVSLIKKQQLFCAVFERTNKFLRSLQFRTKLILQEWRVYMRAIYHTCRTIQTRASDRRMHLTDASGNKSSKHRVCNCNKRKLLYNTV